MRAAGENFSPAFTDPITALMLVLWGWQEESPTVCFPPMQLCENVLAFALNWPVHFHQWARCFFLLHFYYTNSIVEIRFHSHLHILTYCKRKKKSKNKFNMYWECVYTVVHISINLHSIRLYLRPPTIMADCLLLSPLSIFNVVGSGVWNNNNNSSNGNEEVAVHCTSAKTLEITWTWIQEGKERSSAIGFTN